MKKILSVILVLCLALCCFTVCAGAAGTDTTLKFNSDGTFKIAFFADAHFSTQEGDNTEAALAVMREFIAREQPDFVVLGGDNVCGHDDRDPVVEDYDVLTQPLVDAGIPFSLVFGNHDCETIFSKEEALAEVEKIDGCLAWDADESLFGCANHYLTIEASDGSGTEFVLWFFDTGNYAAVHTDQIEWFKSENEQFKSQGINSIVFQHIITEEAVKNVYFDSYDGFAENVSYSDGTASSVIPDFFTMDGVVFENACPAGDNYGEWDALSEAGNVLAVLTGHDHNNCFVTAVDGVDAVQCPGFSACTYGNDMDRGVTVIELNENDLSTYSRTMVYNYQLAQEEGSQIPEYTGNTVYYYKLQQVGSEVLRSLSKFLTIIAKPFVMLKNLMG